MTEAETYLYSVLQKYPAHDLSSHVGVLTTLHTRLKTWAGGCFVEILNSGSRAKGTAISLASDVDYLVSLSSNCNENNGGLKGIYDLLFTELNKHYPGKARKQNVSVRLDIDGLEVDVTPARKQPGQQYYHNIYVSKINSYRQTNIQRHITDISQSGRTDEIKLLKIWRELYGLDFPSIYLEYLVTSNILYSKAKGIGYLANNFWFILNELAKDTANPLFSRIVDPANSNNILSDLMTTTEKNTIRTQAKISIQKTNWNQIVW